MSGGISATTLAYIAVGTAVVGAGLSAVSAIQQGEAASDAAKRNAAIATQNGQIATEQAEANAEIQQRRAAQVIGASRAAFGASGVSIEGSPLDVLASSASASESDRQSILYQGRLKAMGFQNTADSDTAAASNFLTQGYLQAGAGLLKSGASAFARIPSSGDGSAGLGTSGVRSPQIDPAGNYSV